MGIGATIAVNRVAQPSLSGAVTQIRVEQFSDKPTTYSMRFEAEVCRGDFEIAELPELKPRDPNAQNAQDNLISIIADAEGEAVCLVHGIIEQRKLNLAQGGPGSSLEISGSDRRVVLDRNHRQTKYTGRASDAVHSLLAAAGYDPDVQQTDVVYDEHSQTLNQSESDLSFIQKMAKQNGFSLFVDYEVQARRQGPLSLREIAHFKPSPPREQFNSGPPRILLAPERDAVTLIVNVDTSSRAKMKCTNVEGFEFGSDGERPTSVVGTRIANTGPDLQPTNVAGNPLSELGGSSLSALTGGREQAISLVTAGDAAEFQTRAQAALVDAGWFVNAKATTTLHALHSIVVPNTVVEVQGAGREHSGPYFVKSVVHTLDAAVHRMEIELLRNALSEV